MPNLDLTTFFKFIPWERYMSRRFVMIIGGALVGLIVLQAILRKETATQAQPSSSSARQSHNEPKTGTRTIHSFVDSYRQALIRQDPSLMLRHFPEHGNGTLVLYYGKRMTVESLAQTMTASSQTDPVIIRSAKTERLIPLSSPQYRCQAYIATLSLDLETKTQKRQKEVRLYVLEPQPGSFFVLSENNVPLTEPTTQAEDFAKRISRALVRQEPDFLISLYPSLLSGTKVRYYEKDRDSIWIYADMTETNIRDPLEVQRASILSKSDLITSADGRNYYNLRVSLTFRTLSSPAWRKKEIAILFEKQGSGDFQIFLEENLTP